LKKAAQKLYESGPGALAIPTPQTQSHRRLFDSFSSEKELLAHPLYDD
jgi:hypothetical protein